MLLTISSAMFRRDKLVIEEAFGRMSWNLCYYLIARYERYRYMRKECAIVYCEHSQCSAVSHAERLHANYLQFAPFGLTAHMSVMAQLGYVR